MVETGFDPRVEPEAPTVARSRARVQTSDGLELHVRSWRPPAPRASIAIVHGLAEHGQRYGALAVWLAERGFVVHAVDCRGHGDSPGPRVHVDSFDEYAADAAALRRFAADADPALPRILLGHSQGGLVAMLSARRDPSGLAGLAVSSPFLATHPSLVPRGPLALGVRLLLRVAPRLRLPFGAPPDRVSRDTSVVHHYQRDPHIGRLVSSGWFRAGLRAQQEVRDAAPSWPVPTLVMSAGADTLTDQDVVADWVTRAPKDRVTYVPWPGLYHEIFNEPERLSVYATLLSWLESRTSS